MDPRLGSELRARLPVQSRMQANGKKRLTLPDYHGPFLA